MTTWSHAGEQAKAVRRRKEEEVAAAQMEVALGRGEGASWGFGEDAIVDEDEQGVADIDWRTFSETRGLTDKQVMTDHLVCYQACCISVLAECGCRDIKC
jgi:hypothetical protein